MTDRSRDWKRHRQGADLRAVRANFKTPRHMIRSSQDIFGGSLLSDILLGCVAVFSWESMAPTHRDYHNSWTSFRGVPNAHNRMPFEGKKRKSLPKRELRATHDTNYLAQFLSLM